MPYTDDLIKMQKAKNVVRLYAITAATVSGITAIDPEPISGTALVIFADTPIVTSITVSMIIHLAIIYEQKHLIKDGFICAAAVGTGMVLGALGAKVLGGLIPVFKTFNNAIITYGLHYATGNAVIDYFADGNTIKDLKLKNIKEMSKKYKEKGEEKGKKTIALYKSMAKSDRTALDNLTKDFKKIIKKANDAAKEKRYDDYNHYNKEMSEISDAIADIYAKYGLED